MPKLFDLSNWTEQPWWNTGGTRNKKIYLNPNDDHQYYFKQSLKKENKDYVFEFWSEIIAAEIGTLCGFNVLPYHIGVRGVKVGCVSKSMIDPGKEELAEVGEYISAVDNTFNPSDRKLRKKYDFALIIATLEAFRLSGYNKDIVEVLVFDALIGNSDRHQENLAFITEHSTLSKSISSMETDFKASKWLKGLFRLYNSQKVKPEFTKIKLLTARSTRFAPIYDSGCSFGRELTEEKVTQMLVHQDQIAAYVNRGESEIHWENKKVSHFVLLENLLKEDDFKDLVRSTIKRVLGKFDETAVGEIIAKVDVDLPPTCGHVKIPGDRKQLMTKLVFSRFNRLRAMIDRLD